MSSNRCTPKSKKRQRLAVHKNKDRPQEVSSPPYIFDWINLRFGVYNWFDPCPRAPEFDGLQINWQQNNYVNPPFSDIPNWMQKAYYEITQGEAHSVLMLIPMSVHHNYWDELVFGRACAVHIISHPIRFVGYKNRFSELMCMVEYRRGFDIINEPALFWLQFPGWDSEFYSDKTMNGRKKRKYRRTHGARVEHDNNKTLSDS